MSQKPFKILGIEHVGIAVEDLTGIANLFSDILGLEFAGSEEVKDQLVTTDIYKTGSGKVEFIKATTPGSPISRFINKRGEGMHHIAFQVDNLKAALDYLRHQSVQLIDEIPRIGAEGFKIAFIHPKSTGGVLIELCEIN
jgi:methylmalonyl-CoA/ethylmalonyl-CoA epimerase